MDLIKWSPFGDLARWREDFNRFYELPFRMMERDFGMAHPSVEVFESGDNIVVRAELPGIDPKDIDVRVTEEAVTLKGELKDERKEEREGYFHSERRYGSFYRSVPLPAAVQSDQARASFRQGILEITAPKARTGETRGRKLDIDTTH